MVSALKEIPHFHYCMGKLLETFSHLKLNLSLIIEIKLEDDDLE